MTATTDCGAVLHARHRTGRDKHRIIGLRTRPRVRPRTRHPCCSCRRPCEDWCRSRHGCRASAPGRRHTLKRVGHGKGPGENRVELVVGADIDACAGEASARSDRGAGPHFLIAPADRVAAIERALRAAAHLDAFPHRKCRARGLLAVEIGRVIDIEADALPSNPPRFPSGQWPRMKAVSVVLCRARLPASRSAWSWAMMVMSWAPMFLTLQLGAELGRHRTGTSCSDSSRRLAGGNE